MSNPASDFIIERSYALSDMAAQHRVNGRMRLESLPEGFVGHILGYNTAKAAFMRLQKQAEKRGLDLRETSIDQWFLIGDTPYNAVELVNLAQDLQPDFVLSDQSAGRVRLRIEGKDVAHVLNKGIALDLSLGSYPIGKSTPCLCGHIGVHLTRLDKNLFEMIVLRSFAVDLWEQLATMCTPHQH